MENSILKNPICGTFARERSRMFRILYCTEMESRFSLGFDFAKNRHYIRKYLNLKFLTVFYRKKKKNSENIDIISIFIFYIDIFDINVISIIRY